MYPFQSNDFHLILLNGHKPKTDFLINHKNSAISFLAADGAGSWAVNQELYPDQIIGDLDSLDKENSMNIPIQHIKDQNTNDFEKCLLHALKNQWKNILVLGGFGLREDHFLTNLYVLNKYSENFNIFMIDENQLAFIAKEKMNIKLFNPINSYVSLFPLGNETGPISTKNLAYPLNNEYISIIKRLGTLNYTNSISSEIICQSKNLAIFVPIFSTTKIIY